MRTVLPLVLLASAASAQSNVNLSNNADPQSEVDIAVDPTDLQHLVAASNNISNSNYALQIYESTNGGASWTSQQSLLPSNYPVGADPGVAFDAAGNVYLSELGITFSFTQTSLVVSKKAAGATAWSAPVTISAISPDKPFIVADNGAASPCRDRVYVAWDNNESTRQTLRVANSSSAGASFTTSGIINDTGSYAVIGADPQVAADGTLYVAFADFTYDQIRIDKSSDCGVTWGTDQTVVGWQMQVGNDGNVHPPSDPVRGAGPLPSLAVDTSGGTYAGRLYVAFADSRTTGNGLDVWLVYSDDQGATWSTPTRVNDDAAGTSADQYYPRAKVDPGTGLLSIVFYDTRNDPNRKKTDFYLAYSTNGGASFGPNLQLTTAQSDESKSSADQNGYGDYVGLAASSGYVFPAWTDSRGGNEEIYFSSVNLGGGALAVMTSSLAHALAGATYGTTLSALGGAPPYTWSATGLPASLTLDPATGRISGTPLPAEMGAHPLVITVTDMASATANKNLTLTVDVTPLAIATTSLPSGAVSVAYSAQLAATGGAPPFTWSASGLPDGVNLDPSTGALSGTPTVAGAGDTMVAVGVTDTLALTAQKTFPLHVEPLSLRAAVQQLPAGQETADYPAVQLQLANGTPPFSFQWASGYLPPIGLTLSSDGKVAGTPALGMAGAHTLMVLAKETTGAAPAQGTLQFPLVIYERPVADPGVDQSVPPGTVSLDGSHSHDPAMGALSFAWEAPPGLALSDASSAAPTVTLKARGPQVFTLTVSTAQASSAPSSVTYTVQNLAPVVTVGDAAADANKPVTLTASASDPNGDAVQFAWRQVDGAPVALDAKDESATFTASSAGTYHFEVTGFDGQAAGSARATVTVKKGCGCESGSGALGFVALVGVALGRRKQGGRAAGRRAVGS